MTCEYNLMNILSEPCTAEKPRFTAEFGERKIRGKSGFAVNRGFVCFHYAYYALFGRKDMAAVNRGLR